LEVEEQAFLHIEAAVVVGLLISTIIQFHLEVGIPYMWVQGMLLDVVCCIEQVYHHIL